MTLTDTDKMPFGRWKDIPMQDVPVSFLHWFWHECKPWNTEGLAVEEYIKKSLHALETENPNLIWKYKEVNGKILHV